MVEEHPFLYEPTTSITDYIIGLMGLYFGYQTLQVQSSIFHLLWAISFFSLGIGGFLGGTRHGLGPRLPAILNAMIWRAALLFVMLTAVLITASVSTFFIDRAWHYSILVFCILLFIYCLIRIKRSDSFRQVVNFNLPLMIISFFGFTIVFFIVGYTGALFILIGLIVSLVAARVQASGVTLHKHFNHNDLFHVIQMFGMILMYRGGLEIPQT